MIFCPNEDEETSEVLCYQSGNGRVIFDNSLGLGYQALCHECEENQKTEYLVLYLIEWTWPSQQGKILEMFTHNFNTSAISKV